MLLAFSIIWALFTVFREDLERFRAGRAKASGIPWHEAVELCKEMYSSVSEYGGVIPNCRKRTETDTEFIFNWNRSVPIILRNSRNEETSNTGTCIVSKETGEVSYLRLNKVVLHDSRK